MWVALAGIAEDHSDPLGRIGQRIGLHKRSLDAAPAIQIDYHRNERRLHPRKAAVDNRVRRDPAVHAKVYRFNSSAAAGCAGHSRAFHDCAASRAASSGQAMGAIWRGGGVGQHGHEAGRIGKVGHGLNASTGFLLVSARRRYVCAGVMLVVALPSP